MTSFEDRARAEAVGLLGTASSWPREWFLAGAKWAREQIQGELDDALKMIDALSEELVEVGQRSPIALMKLQLNAITAERDELKVAREQEPTERAARRAAMVLHNRLCDDTECDGINDYMDAARAALKAAKEAL